MCHWQECFPRKSLLNTNAWRVTLWLLIKIPLWLPHLDKKPKDLVSFLVLGPSYLLLLQSGCFLGHLREKVMPWSKLFVNSDGSLSGFPPCLKPFQSLVCLLTGTLMHGTYQKNFIGPHRHHNLLYKHLLSSKCLTSFLLKLPSFSFISFWPTV